MHCMKILRRCVGVSTLWRKTLVLEEFGNDHEFAIQIFCKWRKQWTKTWTKQSSAEPRAPGPRSQANSPVHMVLPNLTLMVCQCIELVKAEYLLTAHSYFVEMVKSQLDIIAIHNCKQHWPLIVTVISWNSKDCPLNKHKYSNCYTHCYAL